MNYEEFKLGVLETENKDYGGIKQRFTDENIRLLHGVIGINTEVGEIFECCLSSGSHKLIVNDFDVVNFEEEIGDLFYYIALTLDALNAPIEDVLMVDVGEFSPELLRLQKVSVDMLDMCKKIIFYGKDMEKEFFLDKISVIYSVLDTFAWRVNTNLSKIWEKNNAKLKARYGNKFSKQSALNRDLKNERKILEK